MAESTKDTGSVGQPAQLTSSKYNSSWKEQLGFSEEGLEAAERFALDIRYELDKTARRTQLPSKVEIDTLLPRIGEIASHAMDVASVSEGTFTIKAHPKIGTDGNQSGVRDAFPRINFTVESDGKSTEAKSYIGIIRTTAGHLAPSNVSKGTYTYADGNPVSWGPLTKAAIKP